MQNRTLWLADNINVLKDLPDSSVQSVITDPPFNSNANYSEIDRDDGTVYRFKDKWATTKQQGTIPGYVLSILVAELCDDSMASYLEFMIPRLVEIHRIINNSGSLFLMCDDNAVHYLKVVLDVIFGHSNYRNDIIRRRKSHATINKFGRVHDNILFYTKSVNDYKFNSQNQIERNYDRYDLMVGKKYREQRLDGFGSSSIGTDSAAEWRTYKPASKGRHWSIPPRIMALYSDDVDNLTIIEKLDILDKAGRIVHPSYSGSSPRLKIYEDDPLSNFVSMPDILDDYVHLKVSEKYAYPTQKPINLLKLLIKISTDANDWVLDPFCGSGSTLIAAEHLNRKWIGIDNNPDLETMLVNRINDIGLLNYSGSIFNNEQEIYINKI